MQAALERKASAVQQEFIQLSEQLDDLGRQIPDADEEEKKTDV